MSQVDGFVVAFAREPGNSADEAPRILILLEELLTNLMKYGYRDRSEPGQVEIVLGLNGEFVDEGCVFDPLAEPVSDLGVPPETRPISGLGLHMLRSLTDEARYERRNEAT